MTNQTLGHSSQALQQQTPELVAWLEDCVLLRAVARALALPLPVAATGLDFMHRCRRSGAPWALSSRDLVCGCLYAAAKAEEVQMSTNQAINAARLLELPTNRPLLEALVPIARLLPLKGPPMSSADPDSTATPAGLNPSPLDPAVLVGDAYYSAKEDLFTAEQHVLRHLRWEVHTVHPYKHALHMAACLLAPTSSSQHNTADWGGGNGREDDRDDGARHSSRGGSGSGSSPEVWEAAGPVARIAVCLLHDALTATALGVEEPAEVLAAAAVVAATQLVPVLPTSGQGNNVISDGGRWGDGGDVTESPEERGAEDPAVVADRLVAASGLDPGHVERLAVGLLRLTATLTARNGAAIGQS